jgi:hypothetical protein
LPAGRDIDLTSLFRGGHSGALITNVTICHGRPTMEAFMKKTERISARVEPEILAALQKTAEADRRPIASLVRNIVVDWVRAHEEPVEFR